MWDELHDKENVPEQNFDKHWQCASNDQNELGLDLRTGAEEASAQSKFRFCQSRRSV